MPPAGPAGTAGSTAGAATAGLAAVTTRRARGAAVPRRDEALDAAALIVLTMIGIVGFRPAYGGHGYLAAGAAGVLLGLLLSHLGERARLPLLAVTAAGILAFLLFGGVISQTGTVSLPVLRSVAGTAVSGWQQLLTTARPVGRTAGLLVLPYLLGLFSGVAGYALARRTALAAAPAAAPAVVVALSILFGAAEPAAAVLQGAGFAAVTLAWAAVRQQRGAQSLGTIGRQRPWQRIAAGAAVLAVAAAGAAFIGPHLPGARSHQRVVFYVQPPFDVTAYPSPLAGFRDYTADVPASLSVYGKELLAVSGLPAGSLVRIAAMDTYDGLAWGVANAAASTGTGASFGGFQRVGTLLPGAVDGPARTAVITVQAAYDLPWLPDLAGTTGISFAGPDAGNLQAALRFNVATTTGIIPSGVPAGLRYTVSAGAGQTAVSRLAAASPEGAPSSSIQIPAAVQAFAQAHSLTATTPMGKVLALAGYLRENGRYSNGGGGQSVITAGHDAGRLTSFLEGKQIIGDDEQYAAAMALLANAVGVPARVSLDATVPANGTVYGKDVRADIEVDTAEYGWVTLPASQFTGTKSPQLQQQKVTPPPQPVKVVPPRRGDTAPVAVANAGSAVSRTAATPRSSTGFAVPAIVVTLLTYGGTPLAAVVAAAAALIAVKAARRRRRRSHGPPAARVAGAWRELVDLGRDLGIGPGPAGLAALTRREFAARAEGQGLPAAGAVAAAADAAVFGPADPDAEAAARIWQLVAEARQAATRSLPLRRRTWVAVNPASLLASGRAPDGPRAAARSAAARVRRPGLRPGRPGAAVRG
ncbi:MAG TPA: transglutaminase-like domain-containing protein [Trebonia sp.]|nr:transglutaminase-like domain-containing protein [Trebonia sp.]